MSVAPVAARAVTGAPSHPAPAPRARFADALRAATPEPPHATARSRSLRMLEHVDRAARRLDEVLAQARSGRTFTGAELLALQADAHRFAQTVDLASKVVEQGAQSVKQAINTPI